MIVIPSLATSRDVIVHAPGWRSGVVNRATRVIVTPGGKPLNVARALAAMGVPCALILAADERLAADVGAEASAGVVAASIVTAASSRTDVAIVGGSGELTVINGHPPRLTDEELDRVSDAVAARVRAGDVLVIAGSQPAEAFVRLVEVAARAEARLVLDVSGEDLRTAAHVPSTLVKVNAAELAGAFGVDVERAWEGGPSLLPEAEAVVLTRGAAGLRAWLPDDRIVDVPALVARVMNPYGAGDAVTAALAAVVAERPLDEDALVDASAWAGAAASDPGLGIDPAVAMTLRATVRRSAGPDGV